MTTSNIRQQPAFCMRLLLICKHNELLCTNVCFMEERSLFIYFFNYCAVTMVSRKFWRIYTIAFEAEQKSQKYLKSY